MEGEREDGIGVFRGTTDAELDNLKNIHIRLKNEMDKAQADDLFNERKKEASIVLLISRVYRIAVLNDNQTLEQRQEAATSGEKWKRLTLDLDTAGIRKELREELDTAYTKIKIALQFGDESIKSLDKSTTGFEAFEPI
ncbi:uncharacterized protein PAC_03336 [Phialocephala subalpina]|uniref:Uncharacterized protein n=1 Tax=Phialocephala subalpina TaxID=576137 RepID=A0A1L7WL18_9HELO|nr:uncharacterized protein PAC_03336 [Phialocephala subalpina]